MILQEVGRGVGAFFWSGNAQCNMCNGVFKVTSQSLTRARPPQGQWLLCHELSGPVGFGLCVCGFRHAAIVSSL